jgi:uncharacterized membrane protein HdeD (DUF308 family)
MSVDTVDTTAAAAPASVPWWAVLLQGIAAIILGILLLAAPGATTFVLVQFLGIYWLVSGTFALVSIFLDRTHWVWKLISGILGIIAGILIVQHPMWSAILVPATLVLLLGIQGIIVGVINLFQAFNGGGFGIGILGVLSILFGLVLVFNPLGAAIALPWVLGVLAIVGGAAAIYMAFRLKR